MIPTLVRISAWVAFIVYMIMSFVCLIILLAEKIEFGMAITFFMFLLMSATGWSARKFGLKNYKSKKYSKLLAIITFLFGLLFLVLLPVIFASVDEFNDSIPVIVFFYFLFSPAIVSALALLFGQKINFTNS